MRTIHRFQWITFSIMFILIGLLFLLKYSQHLLMIGRVIGHTIKQLSWNILMSYQIFMDQLLIIHKLVILHQQVKLITGLITQEQVIKKIYMMKH